MLVIAMMVWYGVGPTWAILTLPFFVILAVATALGVGLWLSALNVQYRDVRYTLNFIVQFWLFASPVAYSSTLVPMRWRPFYGINPMAGVIEGFRSAVLGANPMPWDLIGIGSVSALAILVSGAMYFRRTERSFADLL